MFIDIGFLGFQSYIKPVHKRRNTAATAGSKKEKRLP